METRTSPMEKYSHCACLILMISMALLIRCQEKDTDFPVLKGPYLGQKPPGMTPEVFAPGVLNTEKMGAFCSVFSPDGDEFHFVYYERANDTTGGLAWMRRVNNTWTEPEMHHFNGDTWDNDMCMSADGSTLIFRSWRALPDGRKPEDHSYLWFVKRTEEGWSRAEPLYCASTPVRTGYPSITDNGILYFAHRRDERFGIFRSKPENETYGLPEHVFTAVDSIKTEGDMFVAPDESYMIISCWDHPNNIGSGQGDLYITFRKDDGTWTEEKNMGALINTPYGENCPQVSPDGKYFFFNRYNPDAGEGNIYWVDARIIDEHLPNDWPDLQGPYFGRKAPSERAEVFMDGIISRPETAEMCAAFSAEEKEFYYNAHFEDNWTIFITRQVRGKWTRPAPMAFTSHYTDRDFTLSPDGNKIVFGSDRSNAEGGERRIYTGSMRKFYAI